MKHIKALIVEDERGHSVVGIAISYEGVLSLAVATQPGIVRPKIRY